MLTFNIYQMPICQA